MTTEPNEELQEAVNAYNATQNIHGPADYVIGSGHGFRAGWAARGYAITPEFKQGYDTAKAEINAADAVLQKKAALKEQSNAFNLAIAKAECERLSTENVALRRLQELRKNQEPAHTSGLSQPDWRTYESVPLSQVSQPETFSDRLNALSKALGEIKAMNWEKPCYHGTVDSPVPYPPESIAIDCLLSAIARECGGAK